MIDGISRKIFSFKTIYKTYVRNMKKVIVSITILCFLIACGNSDTTKKETAASEESTVDISADPAYTAGLELVGKSDCLTCHKINEKAVGPSYTDIANKYPNNAETHKLLAGKIIAGGSGVWGQVPMTPHPQVSEADAITMVKYILLLKDAK